MKRYYTLLFLLLFPLLVNAQEYWRYYNTTHGMLESPATALAIHGPFDVWMGTETGLSHFDNGVVTHYTSTNSALPDNYINDLVFRNGDLWIATDLGLTQLSVGVFTNFTTSNGLIAGKINALDVDQNGNLWIGTSLGMCQYDGTTFSNDLTFPVYDLRIDGSDNIWIRSNPAGYVLGEQHLHYFDGTTWTSILTDDFSPQQGVVAKDMVAEGNKLYLASFNAGYFIYDGSTWQSVNTSNGLKDDEVQTLAIDNGGNIWASQPLGMVKNYGLTVQEFVLPVDVEPQVSASDFGYIYVGTEQGLLIGEETLEAHSAYEELTANNIRAGFQANNNFFNGPQGAIGSQFEINPGDSTHGIFSAHLWTVAKSVNEPEPRAAAGGYYQSADYFAGPINDEFAVYRAPILHLSRQMIDDHTANYAQAGYITPQPISDWPANGNPNLGEPLDMAPFVDVNSNGYYDPYNGDYPVIRGDQAIFFVMNDARLNHTASSTESIGLEVHTLAYAFDDPGNAALDNTVFLCFNLINRSTTHYDSVKAGFFVDFDLGNPRDDFLGSDSASSSYFVYNGDNFDDDFPGTSQNGGATTSPGFGANPPAVGVTMLSPGLDQFRVLYYGNSNSALIEPQSGEDFFNYLDAKFLDGTPMTYGGIGYNPGSTNYARYMFDGVPGTTTGWSEGTAGNTPFDRRGVGSIPFFSLAPGERYMMDIAVGSARGPGLDNVENVGLFKTRMGEVKTFYDDEDWEMGTVATALHPLYTGLEEAQSSAPSVQLFPNPSNGVLHLQGAERIRSIKVFQLNGQLAGSFYPHAQFNYSVNLPATFQRGVYMVQWTTEEGNSGVEKFILLR